jgi:hypothetical protein
MTLLYPTTRTLARVATFIISAAWLAGCSASQGERADSKDTAQTEVAATADAPMALAWEDLMPEGEEARLEALYAEFYESFEQRMMADQQSLMDAAGVDAETTDISSLIEEGSDDDQMTQIGTFNAVAELNGKHVRIPGYVVPFDFSLDSSHSEFLLVPYFGACLHTPPPPPNQMLFIKADPKAKIGNINDPVWLEGTLSTGRFDSDLGNSAYELTLTKIEPYAY